MVAGKDVIARREEKPAPDQIGSRSRASILASDGFSLGKAIKSCFPLFSLLAISLLGCTSSATYWATEVTIADIKANPEAYQDEEVMVSGEYQGWSAEYGSPPETRSDWVITDETGWIYVTGKSSGLDPVEDRGMEIAVVGEVCEDNGQTYLEGELVIIRGAK